MLPQENDRQRQEIDPLREKGEQKKQIDLLLK
jgi:hypothetical protein